MTKQELYKKAVQELVDKDGFDGTMLSGEARVIFDFMWKIIEALKK